MAVSFTFTSEDINNQTKNLQSLKDECNILEGHLIKMIQLATSNSVVMSFRPVSERASYWLNREAVGKRMDIKHKSANQGLYLSGLIPKNPYLSKLNKRNVQIDPSKILKYKNLKKEYDKNPVIREKTLSIQKDDLIINPNSDLKRFLENSKEQEFEIHYVGITQNNGLKYPTSQNGEIKFYVKVGNKYFNENTGEILKNIPEKYEISPVEVFTYNFHNNEEKYITADYDLMCVGAEGMKPEQLKLKSESSQIAKMSERLETDPELVGSCSFLSLGVVMELNAQFEGYHLITHGDEANNPFPEDFSDFTGEKGGYTFIVPKKGNECEVVVAKNELEVIELYNKLEQEGHKISINPDWGWEKTAKGYKINKYRISISKLQLKFNNFMERNSLISKKEKENLNQIFEKYTEDLKIYNRIIIEDKDTIEQLSNSYIERLKKRISNSKSSRERIAKDRNRIKNLRSNPKKPLESKYHTKLQKQISDLGNLNAEYFIDLAQIMQNAKFETLVEDDGLMQNRKPSFALPKSKVKQANKIIPEQKVKDLEIPFTIEEEVDIFDLNETPTTERERLPRTPRVEDVDKMPSIDQKKAGSTTTPYSKSLKKPHKQESPKKKLKQKRREAVVEVTNIPRTPPSTPTSQSSLSLPEIK